MAWHDDPAVAALRHRTDQAEESVFRPENLLCEARRQLDRPTGTVPPVCLLDPDGDVVRYLRRTGRASRSESWACYHTELWEFDVAEWRVGVVGCAVGALAVEMEAAALYAFAAARRRPVVCFAHVTHEMAQSEGDFEKRPANGAERARALVLAVADGWQVSRSGS